MSSAEDIQAFILHCERTLDLAAIKPFTEFYQHLPLCVIDAVFSMGVRYTSTQQVVERFCQHANLTGMGTTKQPSITKQFSIHQLTALYKQHSVEWLTENIYCNRQRTSTKNGILKSEAVGLFSQVLLDFGVNYLQDVVKVMSDKTFEDAIKAIPGQSSGTCLRYFYILAGSDDHIKPDRMVMRFVYDATGKWFSVDECHALIIEACKVLATQYPAITPSALDNAIWNYQRLQK